MHASLEIATPPTPDEPGAAPEARADPVAALKRLLDRGPILAETALRDGTRLTRRWTHGQLHDHLPAFDAHVLVAHYGTGVHDAVWRVGGERLASLTKPGTVTLIPMGREGRWDVSGSVEVSQVYLPDERIQAAAEALSAGRVELIGRAAYDDPVTARVMQILSDEPAIADPSSRLFVDQAVDLLAAQLIRAHSSYSRAPAPAPRRGLADWQVKKVTAYVREHLEEPVTLDELAALVSLSRFHFATAFRMATGCSPHQWLVQERIGRARALLAHSAMPVTEVALSVGYQTPSSFTAAFRKSTGATPSDFRRAL